MNSPDLNQDGGKGRFTGKKFLAYLLLFFAFMLVGNFALLYNALTTWPGLAN